jgi:predicted MFS family arabinose efflux permease
MKFYRVAYDYLTMKTYTVFLMSVTVFFLFADQNLLAPNLSLIADEFGMSDKERDEKLGGYIAFGFFVVGAPVALLVGYLTDFINRCVLFGVVVALGASASFSTFWVRSYGQLFVCRIFTGISIGGINPVIFSVLGDLFPGTSRIHVSTVIGVSQSAGIATGQFLAGMTGPAIGWRPAFIMVAVPSLISALLVLLTVREPKRGDQEQAVQLLRENKTITTDLIYSSSYQNMEKGKNLDSFSYDITNPIQNEGEYQDQNEEIKEENKETAPSPRRLSTELIALEECETTRVELLEGSDIHYSEKIECRKIAKLFRTASAMIIFIQGFPGCLPWGMIYVFLNDYFSSDRGMTVEAATGALTCFGMGGLVGQLFGGWFGQRLYNNDPRFQAILMGITTILAVGPILYLINTPYPGNWFFYFVALFGGFIVNVNGPNVRVVLQNVCKPEVRGSAFAVFALADDIGKGLGPALVVLFLQACGGNRK